jgi:uncharacterized integral membrane protein
MELCVNDTSTSNPSADDIRRALESGPHPEGWYVVLDAGDGTSVEATARADGAYDLMADDGQRDSHAAAPLTAHKVKSILLKYRAREPDWRDGCAWTSAPSVERGVPARSEPPTWALAIVVGSIVLVVVTALALQASDFLRSSLPFGDSDYFYVGLIFLPMVVLVVVAIAAKMLEVRKASAWSTAVARIVKSGTETRRHRSAGEPTTAQSVPAVEYEFSVGGRTVRGSRIAIGEDSGGANTEATLQRYPVGATVSVYYDPANPRNCVLERDIPKGVGKGLAVLAGLVVAVAAAIYWLVTAAPRLLQAHFPRADAPVTIFAAAMGGLVLLFFAGSWRLSRRAADWPLVRGTVLSSSTEKTGQRQTGRTQVTYAPVVEYGYRVNDVDYVSRQIKLGVTMSASQSYAAAVAARYPEGSTVDVHYEPANPANAALENPAGTKWLLLALAAALFAVAAYTAGAFSP